MDEIQHDPEFGTIGHRLIALRKATGLTRDAVYKSCGIKNPSLRGWERGDRGLKEDNAKILAGMFKAHGLDCTPEWILEGIGLNPLEKLTVTPEKHYILKEITRFKSFYPDAVVLEVTDNNMAPWVRKGDMVGGMLTENLENRDFIGNLCIVTTEGFGTQVRLVKTSDVASLYNLTSFKSRGNILNVSILAVAPIIFLRRLVHR